MTAACQTPYIAAHALTGCEQQCVIGTAAAFGEKGKLPETGI
ncbi:hypothetical protein ACE3MZ_04985 [Paenibacillus sp. WLX1005]